MNLPAGTVLLSDIPGAARTPGMTSAFAAAPPSAPAPDVEEPAAPAAAAVSGMSPGDRVRILLDGRLGTILARRPTDQRLLVKLDEPKMIKGEKRELVVLSPSKLECISSPRDDPKPRKKRVL